MYIYICDMIWYVYIYVICICIYIYDMCIYIYVICIYIYIYERYIYICDMYIDIYIWCIYIHIWYVYIYIWYTIAFIVVYIIHDNIWGYIYIICIYIIHDNIYIVIYNMQIYIYMIHDNIYSYIYTYLYRKKHPTPAPGTSSFSPVGSCHFTTVWSLGHWTPEPNEHPMALLTRRAKRPRCCDVAKKLQRVGMKCTGANIFWLVVSTPLKNISQLGLLFPIYGKIKNVPNHQPVFVVVMSWIGRFLSGSQPKKHGSNNQQSIHWSRRKNHWLHSSSLSCRPSAVKPGDGDHGHRGAPWWSNHPTTMNIYLCMNVCIYVCIYTDIYIYIYIYIYMYIYMYMSSYGSMTTYT